MEHNLSKLPDHSQPANQPVPQLDKDGVKGVVSTLGILLLAPALALFLMLFVFQSYEVDGPSMESTLQNNDRLIVYKLPRTWARITHNPYLPNRGDVVIFHEPDNTADEQDATAGKQLIKRVIALPGERVVVKDGQLTVYNQAHKNGFSPDKTMPYGKIIGQTPGNVDLTVPANQVFVCGDNRTNSFDSRYFGTVPLANVIGKLEIRIYPFSTIKLF